MPFIKKCIPGAPVYVKMCDALCVIGLMHFVIKTRTTRMNNVVNRWMNTFNYTWVFLQFVGCGCCAYILLYVIVLWAQTRHIYFNSLNNIIQQQCVLMCFFFFWFITMTQQSRKLFIFHHCNNAGIFLK